MEGVSSIVAAPRKASEARERLLRIASELFYREGIHGVGMDRVLAEAHVTRATMYRHFPGKEALVVAYLEREDADIRRRFTDAEQQVPDDATGAERVDALIALIADDIERHHTRGCPFINAAAEYPDASSDVRRVVRRHREWFRDSLRSMLEGAGVAEPDEVAGSLVMLRDAALVGGYLDGVEVARPTFVATARLVAHR